LSDWHVSSATHAAVPVFAISTLYGVGQFVRRITATPKAQWVMRCTVAGTSAASEPTWPTADGATVVSGGATFMNVTGRSAHGWSAAAGDIPTLIGAVGTSRFVAGDRLFVSSDHSETQTAATLYGTGAATAGWNSGQMLSVNRAGSVPPVTADLAAGATVIVTTGALTLEAAFPVYYFGLTISNTGTGSIVFNNATSKTHLLDSCQLYLNSTNAAQRITCNTANGVVLYNSTMRFGSASQQVTAANIAGAILHLTWLATASAIAGATIPTTLFNPSAGGVILLTARGVDLSAIAGTLVNVGATGCKYLFDSCRIASGVVRYNPAVITTGNTVDLVELVNCYDGANILNEKYSPAGTVTTERTITLASGATDDVGTFSHKMVSGTNVDKVVQPLDGFWLDVEYQTTGSSKTATVEIISSASLNNDEISLWLQYQGTAGSPVASVGSTGPGSVLGTPSALATSTATWNSSPATPVKQQLSVTFVPQLAGRVRGQVRLGKPSSTVYINPVITIS
jgi:hypothetical protein